MAATPEDTRREIVRLRGDMSAALEEVERRFRGGLRGAATTEARISSVRASEDAISRARQNPTLLGVAGVVVAGAVAYGAFALVKGLRERQKPQNRLKRGVTQVRAELAERLTEAVEGSLHQLEPPLEKLQKLDKDKKRGRSTVIKKFVWAAFLSVFLAVASVVARRIADAAWRAMVHEEPPTEKSQASS